MAKKKDKPPVPFAECEDAEKWARIEAAIRASGHGSHLDAGAVAPAEDDEGEQ